MIKKKTFFLLIPVFLVTTSLGIQGGVDSIIIPASNDSFVKEKSSLGAIRPSITESDLPSNLAVAFDQIHYTLGYSYAVTYLQNNLTLAGSKFRNISGSFSIPMGTNVLLIPACDLSFTGMELDAINDWFTSGDARLIWVAGDSDYNGYYPPGPNNELLATLGTNLRMGAEGVSDAVYNDGQSYRVVAQTPVSDGEINSIVTKSVSSAVFHAPTPILGYQSGELVDLAQTSIDGVEIVMKASINATVADQDLSATELDYYSTNDINGSYPLLAIQSMGNHKYVVVSGETIFANYQHMYDLFTSNGVWNGGVHDGKTLVDNILFWFGREAAKDRPLTIHGNADFRGFPGSGTSNDPYRIEGYNIIDPRETLISISDTDAYFSLSDNNLDGMMVTAWGINLNNVSHGTIRDNHVIRAGDGIALYFSDNNVVTDNTLLYCLANGIRLENTTDNNLITNNIIRFNGAGIWIGNSCEDNYFSNNEIKGNSVGIALTTDSGIGFNDNNTIFQNFVIENFGHGILLEAESDENHVSNNLIFGNEGVGLSIGSASDSNTIISNDFSDNNINCIDDGANNDFTKNYWDDWTGKGSYSIKGSAGSEDMSPLENLYHMTSPTIITPTSATQTLENEVTIQWTASTDLFDHIISYAVFYSTDEGDTWNEIVSDLSKTDYVWDLSNIYDGTVVYIMIEATDDIGFHSSSVSSSSFTITNPSLIPPITTSISSTTMESSSTSPEITPTMTGIIVFLTILCLSVIQKKKQ
ncbi:MAG: NosD domain-containing protein [Candidatus Hodarchaeota archaeon]